MRGKVGKNPPFAARCRITPACAGKRLSNVSPSAAFQDHPRVCGEKMMPVTSCSSRLGSPPRVRGKGVGGEMAQIGEGITPACAGKSCIHRYAAAGPEDHPRVCGEKSASPSYLSGGRGSPPRVRGKGVLDMWKEMSAGITPACAGKSIMHGKTAGNGAGSPPRVRGKVIERYRRGYATEDHPRVCGEK